MSNYRTKPGFYAGMLAAVALLSMNQDLLGLDRYVQLVRDGWINTRWWMWALVAVLAIWSSVERKKDGQ